MSARILYSLTDDKAGGGGGGGAGGGGSKHIGCMNGIFQLFDRGHFLPSGRRLSGSGRRRLTTGQNENCGAEDDVVSIISTGKVSKAAVVKERHRLSTDSSRSSASSSCNSSNFSSVEDHKPVTIATVNSTDNGAKDLPRLQQLRGLKDSGEIPQQKSAARTYVDSPRPVLPPKVTRERNSASSKSLKELRSLDRPRNFVDSPRFSYDGQESREEIKSRAMKLKDQPRHSLDSKRSSLSSLSLKVQQQQEYPGSCKWHSTVVAKLMGLEASHDVQVSSRPPTGHSRNSSVDALDLPSVFSRTANNCTLEANADLVVRLKPNEAHVLDKVSAMAKESPLQSPTLSVYGELEKRLEQIEFKRSGKDLRALKQILEAMQRSKQPEDDTKKINRVITRKSDIGETGYTAKFASQGGVKSPPPMTSHEVSRPLPLAADIGLEKGWIQPFRNRTSGLPKIQVSTKIRRNSSDQQRTDDLTPRASPIQAHYTSRIGISTCRAEDRRQIAEGDIPGRNFRDSNPWPLRKKLEPVLSRDISDQPGRKPRQFQSPCKAPNPKVRGDHGGGNSRKLIKRSNRIPMRSYDNHLLASRDDDKEITSPCVAKNMQTAQALSRSKVDEESPSESGTTLGEQPSPVSVLGPSNLEDESPSPVKAFRDEEAPRSFHGKGQGLHNRGDSFSGEKHCQVPKKAQAENTCSDHTYILQTLSSSGLLGNPDAGNLMTIRLQPSGAIMTNLFSTLGDDKLCDYLQTEEDLSEGFLDLSQSKHGERIQRKLLFDVIDEILIQKLTSNNNVNRFLPRSLAVKKTGQEQLLEGLHSEIAHLQFNNNSKCNIEDEDEDFIRTILRRDLERESQSWKGFYDDSGIVLDIERLIFKDLVTEVVTGNAAVMRSSLTSHCRQMAIK
ncbi:hypothetical protein MLD38_001285 [Melastoma candidum]|uniref:Uncharacterized protein n=1 Tax=Melastoma candidum TaxID=119954 RepID=A0ACB9SG36_9MYRT|nr:hypothetical protein MLD38_001285 [Melastoma candidum]